MSEVTVRLTPVFNEAWKTYFDERNAWTPNNPDTQQWELDLARDLGYEVGFEQGQLHTLTVNPFTCDGEHIIATEVVVDADGRSTYVDDERVTRTVRHTLPAGWSIEVDHTPRYELIKTVPAAGLTE